MDADLGQDILQRRESRAAEQARWLAELGLPLVSGTIVSPGEEKDDPVARSAADAALQALRGLAASHGWRVRRATRMDGPDGPEFLAAVDADPRALKSTLVTLEDLDPRGRLFDLDVLARTNEVGLPIPMSRTQLGLPPRRCLVCDRPAKECARSLRHPSVLVRTMRDGVATGYSAESKVAADLAVQALLEEARLTPKPGLVDAATNGAHHDMDLALLEASAEALRPWLRACWLTGAVAVAFGTDPLPRLVELGIAGEASMNQATGGINTHKGALFALGLILAAHGELRANHLNGRVPERRLRAGIRRLATPLFQEWLDSPRFNPTHGDRAFRDYGITGARGEAASGFTTVFNTGLPSYRTRLLTTGDEADALRWALACIMAVNPDTNLIARGGRDGLADVRAWASALVRTQPAPDELVTALADADRWFTDRWLSPGGSADLLAITWLIDRLVL